MKDTIERYNNLIRIKDDNPLDEISFNIDMIVIMKNLPENFLKIYFVDNSFTIIKGNIKEFMEVLNDTERH